MQPLVYLREGQIRDFVRSPQGLGISHGVAFGWDDWTVLHAYTEPPKSRPAGLPCLCLFHAAKAAAPAAGMELPAALLAAVAEVNGQGAKGPFLASALCLEADVLRPRALLFHDGERAECAIRYVPEKSELYSRSRGLLEVEVLEKKSVGIVGLGSGGSLLAIELAKAGVGRFVLIDFDRLELSNVSRHVCGINDLGRYKTLAVRDAIWQKNPYAQVETLEIDLNTALGRCTEALSSADLILCASDTERSRLNVNSLALQLGKMVVFGRAITRAAGGDILRTRPGEGPCYLCLFAQQGVRDEDQEISSVRQAREVLPGYTSEAAMQAQIQVGLSSDIAPISNLMVKLALVELSRGLPSGISSLEEDLEADYYVWANRRERTYEGLQPMAFSFNRPSVLRWYGAKVPRDSACNACGEGGTLAASNGDGFFG